MFSFATSKQPYHTILLPFLLLVVWSVMNLPSVLLVPTVSQLQQTLVSVQELLIQQQQKIQELSQELAAAEVATTSSAAHHSSLYTTNSLKFVRLSVIWVKPLRFSLFVIQKWFSLHWFYWLDVSSGFNSNLLKADTGAFHVVGDLRCWSGLSSHTCLLQNTMSTSLNDKFE